MQKVLILPAEFSEVRRASGSGGTSLTSTAGLISLPFGADWMSLTAYNFSSTCSVVKFAINPYLTIVTTTSSLTGGDRVGGAGLTSELNCDISKEMQDGDATNFAIDSLDTADNDNYIYVGSPLQFRGVAVDIGTDSNATASELTVKYWGGTWIDISDTDNTRDTASSTKTMAQDGNVEWTVPSAWIKESLLNIGDTALETSWSGPKLYWTRWEVDATIDTADIAQIRPLNRSTNYAELMEGQAFEHTVRTSASEGISCIEALTDAGTAKMVVNVATVTTTGLSSRERFV